MVRKRRCVGNPSFSKSVKIWSSLVLHSNLSIVVLNERSDEILVVIDLPGTEWPRGLAPWRSGIAPESIGGVYGHNAMSSNPSASGWGTPPFNRLAPRRRDMGLCHTLSRVHTVWIKQKKPDDRELEWTKAAIKSLRTGIVTSDRPMYGARYSVVSGNTSLRSSWILFLLARFPVQVRPEIWQVKGINSSSSQRKICKGGCALHDCQSSCLHRNKTN